MANWLNETREFMHMPLSEQIKTKRLVDGFSQKELCKMLNMAQMTLSKVERGCVLVPVKSMKLVCEYLYGTKYYRNGKLVRDYENEQ